MKGLIQRYMQNRGAIFGLAIIILVAFLALAAPLLYDTSPWMMVAAPLIPPFTDAAYPFGTDMLGRDLTPGLVWGARVSLTIGPASTIVAPAFVLLRAALAGFYGGMSDDVSMRLPDCFR